MSLLDARLTPAWTTVQIDYGPAFGAQRYGGYAPMKYLDNISALQYAQAYPLGSSVFQWNGANWQPLIKPRAF
jgi:hypothetical protein